MPKKMVYDRDGHKSIVNVIAFVSTSFGTMNAVWKAIDECSESAYHQDPVAYFRDVD